MGRLIDELAACRYMGAMIPLDEQQQAARESLESSLNKQSKPQPEQQSGGRSRDSLWQSLMLLPDDYADAVYRLAPPVR